MPKSQQVQDLKAENYDLINTYLKRGDDQLDMTTQEALNRLNENDKEIERLSGR